MAERSVTVDGTTYELKRPFFVIATQNPVDHEGTFPLPEAQLDRFLIRLSLGYPTLEEEGQMLQRLQHEHPIDQLSSVVTGEQVIACQQAAREVFVHARVQQYLLEIVHATRDHDDINLGGSPRASIALFRTSQALAAIRGRNFVQPDDIKRMAGPVLLHRLILRPESRLRKVLPETVLEEVMESIRVPTSDELQAP